MIRLVSLILLLIFPIQAFAVSYPQVVGIRIATTAPANNNRPQVVGFRLVKGGSANLYASKFYGGPMVGYWKFDEAAGTTATDSSGLGLTGTYVGSPTWTSTVPTLKFSDPYAVTLNGSSQYVVSTRNSGYTSSSQPFSISTWVYPTNTGTTGPVIVATAPSVSPFDGIWLQYGEGFGTNNTNSIILGEINTTGASSIYAHTATNTVPSNQWSNIIATYNGSGTSGMAIYINGVSQSLTTSGNTLSGSFTNRPWYIGSASNAGAGGFFAGSIDDVRIYKTALTAQQVTNLYNGYDLGRNTLIN